MHWSVIVLLLPLIAILIVMLGIFHAYGSARSLRRVKALLKRWPKGPPTQCPRLQRGQMP